VPDLIPLLSQILNGLLAGSYYLMIALGLSMIFSLGGIVNLAHGAFYALGAYLAVTLSEHIGFGGALIASPLLVALIGMAMERFLLRRFYSADPILGLLLTFGLAMVAEQALRIAYGAAPVPFSIPQELRGQVFLGDFVYSRYRLIILAITALSVAGLWVLLTKTAFGKVVRAGVQDPDMVGALGISLKPYMTAVVMIGVGLAALAGVLIAPIAGVHPAMGQEIITFAFVVVVIGGLGSFWGVVAAAAIVGVTRGVAAHFYPAATEASVYLLMVLVLLLRPRGLFGERIQKFE
jgi:branched-chain amino acid transport system permease protein